ncbi:hypothetical protein WA158_001851 [Blastocystis sp. Blastoise]
MTTAQRATWVPSVGISNTNGEVLSSGYFIGGSHNYQTSFRDMPAHLKMKYRHIVAKPAVPESIPQKTEEKKTIDELNKDIKEQDDKIVVIPSTKSKSEEPETKKDDNFSEFDDSDEDSEKAYHSDSDDDSEDEATLLRAELEKVKKEKELEKKKEEEEKLKMKEAQEKEKILRKNALMFQDEQTPIKRKWNDDVPFRNQGKEIKHKKRFINDTIRNDFHLAFMKRYIH